MSIFNAMLKSMKANFINILVYFCIFAVFGNMQAKATTSNPEKYFEEITMNVAVTDYDNSELSKALVNYLKDTQNVVDPRTSDPRVMNDNVRFSIYDYAIIIPEDFEERIMNNKIDGCIEYIAPGPTTSEYLLTEKLNDYMSNIVVYLNSGYTKEQSINLTHDQMIELNDTVATVIDTSDENHRSFYTGIFTFNGYTLLMLLSICCASVLSFIKDMDVKNRISVSGMHFMSRNMAIIGSVLFIGCIITTLVICFIQLLSGDNTNNKLIFYAMDAFALMFVGLGMAYFICSVTANENLINMLSNMLVLSMSFLCGIFVDIEFLSDNIVKIAHFMPLYWYNMAIRFINNTSYENIFSRQFGTYLSIEILFALVFFAAGMIISRKKEQYAV